MMKAIRTFALALGASLLLLSCFFSPGEFTSSLDIRKDRSFRFAYQGEVIVNEPDGNISVPEDGDSKSADAKTDESVSRLNETQVQKIVEALRKEEGYRSVEYIGESRFRVDYEIAGRLDHNFVYPINLDAGAILPWIVIELRAGDTARVNAVAFGGDQPAGMPVPGAGTDPNRFRNGTFTLTTDAEIVMHNNESGMAPGPERRIVWPVIPTTGDAPTAVVAFGR